MSLSTVFAALLYLAGIAAVIVGLRSLLSKVPHVELRPDSDLRRSARIARIEAAKTRGIRSVDDQDGAA